MSNKKERKRKLIYFLLIFLCSIFLLNNRLCLAQEQVTITTYYPAPYGVYNELRSKRMAIGDTYYNPASTTVPASSLIVENAIGVGTKTPVGKFDVNMGNNYNYFSVNYDNNIGVEMRSGTTGGWPYIDFSNDTSTDFDFRIWLLGNDTFELRGGVARFSNESGTPAIIRVGEVWFCINYADSYP